MAKSDLVKVNESIAEAAVSGYKAVESTVVGGYKSIEKTFVDGFTSIEDRFVDNFLTKDGETVEEAKQRLARENEARQNPPKP